MQDQESLEQICAQALLKNPEAPAIEFEEHWYNWGDVRRVADQLVNLIDASGAADHPKVAFVAHNRPSALAAFLGLLARGCTIRMVYPFQSAAAIAHEVKRIQPAVVVAAEKDFSDDVLAVLQQNEIAAIGLCEMQARAHPGYERTASRSDEPGQPEIVLLTSGTTGPPKQFAMNYETVCRYYGGITGQKRHAVPTVANRTPALLYFPVSNISGLYTTLPALLSDNPIVLLDRFNLQQWREFVLRYRPKFFGMPPAGYKMLLDADIPMEDLSSIEVMGAGAAPLDPNVQKEFEERYGIPILLSYGATEFGGPVTGMTLDLWKKWGQKKFGSVGKPYEGMKVRIVDEESGEELAAGGEGIIEVVSCRIGPDWIRTSDLGVVDEDGFLFLKGRADGAIIRGGFKLVPATIETALLKNPRIAMAAVVGVPDERLGQVPAAAIVLKPGVPQTTFAQIETELREHVPATYIPTTWRFVSDLPRTPSLKIDIAAVKRLFDNRPSN